MVPTQGRCALVSLTKHHHRQLLSADHFHHGLLAGNSRREMKFKEREYSGGGMQVVAIWWQGDA